MSIRFEIQDGIAVLTFDRSERRHALTAQMYAQLADGLAQAEASPDVRVALLQGDAETFTAGNDIGDFLANPPQDGEAPVHRFLRGISTFRKPLIAAVCGPAVGVGSTMLLHCDLVYAGDNARFSFPFVNLGLIPEAASSLLLPRLAGHVRAAEAFLFGEPFDAVRAQAMGIVNEVLPAAQVIARARARAADLAAKPLSSLMATKALMKAPLADAVAQQMDREGRLFGPMLTEPAAREAFTAFKEKRKPDFSKLG